MSGEIELKTSILALLAALGLAVSFAAQARVVVRTCTNYTVHVQIVMPDGSVETFDSPGQYCWNEYLPEPGDQPFEPIVDLPGFDDPEIPDDEMCATTLLTWPAGCNKDKAPTAIPNGCTAVPDSDGFAASFTSSCDKHDICYTTPGSSKSQCDQNLGSDMTIACNSTYDGMIGSILSHLGPLYINGQLQTVFTLIRHKSACTAQASAYKNGVAAVSATRYYLPAQKVGVCITAHRDRWLYCGN